jgi:DNA-binding CsgD family transcriptional regulator
VAKRILRRKSADCHAAAAPSLHRLTRREKEILDWVAYGKSNSEIAAILGITSATVGKHLEHIYPKLGVENRTAAASFAWPKGPGSGLNI